MEQNKTKLPIILIILFLLILSIFIIISQSERITKKIDKETRIVKKIKNKNKNQTLSISLLKKVNKKENYLISPYSIEIALNMLKEGSQNNTYKEINNLTKNRDIKDITINKRVSVANALFVKNKYKGLIENDYLEVLTNKYQSDILYDSFENPDLINNWVNEKTYNMIPKLIDKMNPSFALGIVNALAIDVDWYDSFDCIDTDEETFNNYQNEKIQVEMMSKEYEYDAEYFETKKSKGIIIPYAKYNTKTGEKVDDKKGEQLEFIGILPNNDLYDYINSFSEKELKEIDNRKIKATNKKRIKLKIPRFSYDYEIKDFINVLYELGIKDAFDSEKADFTKMIAKENQDGNIYVGEAIHKTHIDLNEKGTKAAAVTYFGLFDNALVTEKYKEVKITFDKPFIYIIRDKKSKEIIFIGTVYEPNEWKGRTCSEKENTN